MFKGRRDTDAQKVNKERKKKEREGNERREWERKGKKESQK